MKIGKTASLPLKIIGGTVKARQIKMSKITEEIFNKIVEKPQDLSIKRIEQIMQDTLTKTAGDGRKINLIIKELKETQYGGIQSVISKNGIINGFEIHIPIKNDAIKEEYFAKFMHELTHLLHQLTDPRTLAKINTGNITKKQATQLEKFYQNSLYKQEIVEWFNPITTKIKQIIATRTLNNKEKINALQESRHRLISELLAYRQEEKYQYLALNHGIKAMEPFEFDNIMLNEKIKYLEKEIFKLIKKVRKSQ